MKLLLALLFSLIANAALAQNPTCPTRPAGDNSNACASTSFATGGITNLLATPNTWTALQTFSAGISINATPTYNLASNTLAVPLFMPLNATTQTVAASNTFSAFRLSNNDGTDISFTLGANSVGTGPYSSIASASGSSASSNLYGLVGHATLAGPGTGRGAHLGGFGLSGSTGAISAAALEIKPVATNSTAHGAFASLTSSGVNGLAVGYGIETLGDTYSVGFGSTIAPVGYTTAAYRAWMATASGAIARAFQTLQNDGTEIQYIKKTGEVVSSTALIAGTEANGINVTQAAVTRNNVAGSMTFAAGTNAGNTFAIQTGGLTRLAVADASTQFGGAGTGNGTAVLNGNTSGAGTIAAAATAGHMSFASSSVPTLTAGCNGAGSVVSGSDLSGTITGQTAAATTCTLTFGTVFAAAPRCVVTGLTSPLTGAVTPAAATLVVNFASTANYQFNYFCPGV